MHVFNPGAWGVGHVVFQDQGMLLEQQPCSHLHDVLLDGSEELLCCYWKGSCVTGVAAVVCLGGRYSGLLMATVLVKHRRFPVFRAHWTGHRMMQKNDDQGREKDYALPVITHVTAGQPPS